MSGRIQRFTMFKLPRLADQRQLIEAYEVLMKDAKKEDDKPYILSMKVRVGIDDARSQGWTVMSMAEFANLEDMRYYDEQCKAHTALKEKVKALELEGGVTRGIMVIYFEANQLALDLEGEIVASQSATTCW